MVQTTREVKFLQYSDWAYNSRFKVIDTAWIDVKNMRKTSMVQVNTRFKDCYKIDWYHVMGCYGVLKNEFVCEKRHLKILYFPIYTIFKTITW